MVKTSNKDKSLTIAIQFTSFRYVLSVVMLVACTYSIDEEGKKAIKIDYLVQ